jgi:hypothetical protein
MARGKQRAEWEQVSLLAAKIHNAFSDNKTSPNDFNPFKKPTRKRKPTRTIRNPHELGFGTPGVVK